MGHRAAVAALLLLPAAAGQAATAGSTASSACTGLADGGSCAKDGSSSFRSWSISYTSTTGKFNGTVTTNLCSQNKYGFCQKCNGGAGLDTSGQHQAQCTAQTVPAPGFETAPKAAPLRGRVGLSLAGVNIYGPMENGFGIGNAPQPCTNGQQGQCSGGLDVLLCEAKLEHQCGASNVSYGLMLDTCGGHAMPYHYHGDLTCDYNISDAGHSPLIGIALDGSGIYGMNEATGTKPTALDPCNGHTGQVPATNRDGIVTTASTVYHYHVTNRAPYTVGCFGPVTDIVQCQGLYAECGTGFEFITTAALPTGICYDLDCPCYNSNGHNAALSQCALPTAAPSVAPSGTPTRTPTRSPATNQVATPYFLCPTLPCTAGGIYQAPLLVAVTSATAQAQYFYTLNGSTPTLSSARYTSAISISAAGAVRLQALGTRADMAQSNIGGVTLIISGNQPPTGTLSTNIVNVDSLQPFTRPGVLTGVSGPEAGQTVSISCSNSLPTLFSSQPVVSLLQGQGSLSLTAVAAGEAVVSCNLTDNGNPPAMTRRSFTVNVLGFVSGGKAPTPQFLCRACPASGCVTAECQAGAAYVAPLTITIAVTDMQAQVFYTTDGTTPTALSTRYVGPIAWAAGGSVHLRAVATRAGMANSDIAARSFTVVGSPLAPTASPSSAPGCQVYVLSGFAAGAIDGSYTIDQSRPVNGRPTYWTASSGHLIYYCPSGAYYYLAARASSTPPYYAAAGSTCLGLARATQLSPALSAWQENVGAGGWVSRPVSSTCSQLQTNQAPTVTLTTSLVTVPALGVPFSTGIVTSVRAPEVGQVVVASCTAQSAGIFSAGPQVTLSGSSGTLTLTARAEGQSQVTCTFTDNGSPPMSRSVTFVVQTAAAPAPTAAPTRLRTLPPTASAQACSTARTRRIRLRLRQTLSAFRVSTFTAAVRAAVLSVTLLSPFTCIDSVCPEGACSPEGVCPVATADRVRAGCQLTAQLVRRTADRLQGSTIYVDFDVVTPGGTTGEQDRALADLNRDVALCQQGGSCALAAQNPAGMAAVVQTAPTSAPTADSDDGLAAWVIAVIVAAAVVCLLFVVLLIYLLCRSPARETHGSGDSRGEYGMASKEEPSQVYRDVGWAAAPAPSRELSPAAPARQGSLPGNGHAAGSLGSARAQSPQGLRGASPGGGSAPPPPAWQAASLPAGTRVSALFLDGQFYDAIIWNQGDDGSYGVQWYDGTFSDGIPPEQVQLRD